MFVWDVSLYIPDDENTSFLRNFEISPPTTRLHTPEDRDINIQRHE